MTRRWSATVRVYGHDPIDVKLDSPTEHCPDLMREVKRVAVGEAGSLVLTGLYEQAWVRLYKTTKTHGTVPDRQFYVWREGRRFKVGMLG